MATPAEWYNALPIVSRVWLSGAVLTGLGSKFGLFNPMTIAFIPDLTFQGFQVCVKTATVFPSPSTPSLTNPSVMALGAELLLFWHSEFQLVNKNDNAVRKTMLTCLYCQTTTERPPLLMQRAIRPCARA